MIPGRRNRQRPIQYDERRYKDRRVGTMFCRLKDFRQIATRYDSSLETSYSPYAFPPPRLSG